jgi:hypothetical protein
VIPVPGTAIWLQASSDIRDFMEAKQFVKELWDCAPSMEALSAQGLSAKEAHDFRHSYMGVHRTLKTGAVYSNPLIELIENYAMSGIEIGMITFLPHSLNNPGYWQVGEIETDPLIVEFGTEAVRVIETAHLTHTLWECASSADRFLDAVIVSARCLSNAGRSDRDVKECIMQCEKLAGGFQYRSFYQMLFGT